MLIDDSRSAVGMRSPQASDKKIYLDRAGIALWITAAFIFAFTWFPRLVRSLWVDEAGTFFMAHRGPLAAIQITSHWPGQSILYAVIESLFVSSGSSHRDLILRVPSVAAILLAAWFLYRLAEGAFGKGAGFLAAVLFVFHPNIISLGTEARPYSLALAAVTGSCLALYQWIESREVRYVLWFIASTTLVVYLHYFFAIIFVCQAFYIAYVFVVERRVQRWTHLLTAYALVGVFVTPLVPHMRLLLREAHTLPFTDAPTPDLLCDFLLTPMLSLGLVLAAVLIQFAAPNRLCRPRSMRRPLLVLVISWWLAAPLIFFLASVTTPMRVFLPRYMASAVPGQVLLFAYIGYSLFEMLTARFWVLSAILLSTASPFAFRVAHRTGPEELAPFIRIIQEHSVESLPPVLYSSPLPESDFYNWKAAVANESYLYAPFVAYPMKNRLLPLPFTLATGEVQSHIAELIKSDLARVPEVIFVSHAFSDEGAWNAWLITRMKAAGFTVEVQTPNLYHVLIFTRQAAAPNQPAARSAGRAAVGLGT